MKYWILWFDPDRSRWVQNWVEDFEINTAFHKLIYYYGDDWRSIRGYHFRIVEVGTDLDALPKPEGV